MIGDCKTKGKGTVGKQCSLVCKILPPPQGGFNIAETTIYVSALKINLMHTDGASQVVQSWEVIDKQGGKGKLSIWYWYSGKQ